MPRHLDMRQFEDGSDAYTRAYAGGSTSARPADRRWRRRDGRVIRARQVLSHGVGVDSEGEVLDFRACRHRRRNGSGVPIGSMRKLLKISRASRRRRSSTDEHSELHTGTAMRFGACRRSHRLMGIAASACERTIGRENSHQRGRRRERKLAAVQIAGVATDPKFRGQSMRSPASPRASASRSELRSPSSHLV